MLIYLSGAWIAGIWLGSQMVLPAFIIVSGLAPLPLLFFKKQSRKRVILVSICLFLLCGAAVYAGSGQRQPDENRLSFYNETGTIQVRGMVAKDPEVRDTSTRLKLSAITIKQADSWRKIKGTVLLSVPRYPAHDYGDIVTATGILETPPRFDDFDYAEYLAHQGIYSVMYFPDIKKHLTSFFHFPFLMT